METILNADEQDVLRELLNVAYGRATASISQILDAFATLHIPKIKIIRTHELKDHFSAISKEAVDFIGVQAFKGEIAGQSVFLIDESSSKNLTNHLYEGDVSIENIRDSILELTNILSSSILSSLSENFNTPVNFSAPSVSTIINTDILSKEKLEKYNYVIIITTLIEFKEININGEIILITDDTSIQKIKTAIAKILEEF